MTPDVTTRKIAELHALRSRISRWRMGTPIAIIVVVVFALMSIYTAGGNLARPGPTRDEFVSRVQQGMNEDVVPIVRHVAYQTFQSTKSAVQDELQKISERTPEFSEAMYKEVETLVENIPMRTQEQLSDVLAESLAKQEDKIAEMFPEVTKENVHTLIERLVVLAENQTDTLSTKLFERHLISINNIIDDLEAIRKSETIRPDDELASWEMALLVFDILRSEFDEVHPAPIAETKTPPSENPTAADQK